MVKGLRIGEECSVGCRDNVATPCKKCGRYNAGLHNYPDINAVMRRLYQISLHDPIVNTYINLSIHHNWTEEQLLAAMVMTLHEINAEMYKELIDIKIKTGMI